MAGGGYLLSFWLRNASAGTNRFQVEWGGSSLYGVDSMALHWFYLDDVSVDSAVPEPGAFQLTLIGAAMIFAAGRFRRRRG